VQVERTFGKSRRVEDKRESPDKKAGREDQARRRVAVAGRLPS
jgi:hypothetical protein